MIISILSASFSANVVSDQNTKEPIGDVIKRLSSAYVFYYNHKYGRIGHLFQERFKSQPVEDWNYFMTLLRYIHQNPLKLL